MAIRNIVKLGDDILRKKCRTQMEFDSRLATILDDMAETMYQAEGVGLAAPPPIDGKREQIMPTAGSSIDSSQIVTVRRR